ncbi:hypothetical protein EV359DRAFT_87441 [Lentinula novae-zelandiae]|nr:hypothetical protein EV359DRAFT_87441 [Lentinula novae-zelandiae]
MDISLKLKLNFKIDKENRKQQEKSLELQLGNPADDALDIASFITIDTISLDNVRKDPTTFERLKDFLTTDTLDFFRQRNEEEGDRQSRTRGREDEAKEGMRKKQKPGKVTLVPRSAGPRVTSFDTLLFDTINVSPIFPLFLFTNKNLDLINTHMPKLKRAKILHIKGKPHILDLKEIAKWVKETGGISCDKDLDFIQWSQAAKNFYQFECLRDGDLGKEAPRALFYVEHFAFFLNQQDSEDFFTYWLKVEVKLRKEHQSKLYAFDSDMYEREWTLVCAEHISDAKYTTSSSAPPPTQSLPSKTTSSSMSQKPFPTGSKKRTAIRTSAGTGTFEDNAEAVTRNTAARSVAAPPTTHSNGNALPSPPSSREDLKDFLIAPPLRFHGFADSIIIHQALPDASIEHVKLYK